MRFSGFLILIAGLATPLLPAAALDEGEIEGAAFAIARPARWNRSLLLTAHGRRDEGTPLIADIPSDREFYKTLLDAGWMIATTSYRRNGIIVEDAIKDLDNLRAHIVAAYGNPKRVILMGDSMGGTIVTIMAERTAEDPPWYHGAIAIDPSMSLREPGSSMIVSNMTKIPLLFLANQGELEGPRTYITTPLPPSMRPVTPVLFQVSRQGHININQQERLTAMRAMIAWLDQGPGALPPPAKGQPHFDATHTPEPVPSQVAMHDDNLGFTATVTEVTAVFGNLAINAQPADFAAVGIGNNAWFKATVNSRSQRVFFGRNFSNVKRGEWITFPQADGFFWLARNHASAAASLNAKVGDAVEIRAYREVPAGEGEGENSPR